MPDKVIESEKLTTEKRKFVYRHFDNNLVPKIRKCNNMVSHYDFQINDKSNQLETVFIETVDIDKEVQSHADEVGLINVIKLASAMGVNPNDAPFAKKIDGSNVMTEDIETFDDIKNLGVSSKTKLDEIASKLGLTSEELVKGIESGNYESLVQLVESKKVASEGGDNNG